MTKDYLFEIGTEEIPARFMAAALKQMEQLLKDELQEARLGYASLKAYGTPRRLALLVLALEEKQKDKMEEVKGPAKKAAFDEKGEPSKALLGFCRSKKIDLNEIEFKEIKGVEYVYGQISETGQAVQALLPAIMEKVVNKIYFPKPMRWGDSDFKFARPIRWVVSLFGEEVLALNIAGKTADRITYGHRFLAPQTIELKNAVDYVQELEKGQVLVDQEKRSELIWQQIQTLATQEGGQVKQDEELLEEINYLLEYPTALCGKFAEEYLAIPSEVLITTMKENQKYFPVYDDQNRLLNKFITVRNGNDQHLATVAAGNEKVLKARLEDAVFFYKEDVKQPLAKHIPGLHHVVFHEKLGSLFAKTKRTEILTGIIGNALAFDQETITDAQRAAYLAKGDLLTNMVYEFPEVQGVMGYYYALKSQEKSAVAVAIKEHYLPAFAGDETAATKPGILVALADKLDSLAGFFALNIIPTGSQDPYALRRQAQGVVHTIIDNKLNLSLQDLCREAYQRYEGTELVLNEADTCAALIAFFQQRMENIFKEYGYRYDLINAVLSSGSDDIYDLYQKLAALDKIKEKEVFAKLIGGYIRVANLAQKADSDIYQEELLTEPAEIALGKAFAQLITALPELEKNKDYDQIFAAISRMQEPIDEFFDHVMVMVDDEKIKNNRLGLLKKIALEVEKNADLSQIVLK